MIRGVSWFYSNKDSAAGSARFSGIRIDQRAFDCRAIFQNLNTSGFKDKLFIDRSRSQHLDRIFRCDRTRGLGKSALFHQSVTCGPITVAVENGSDDASVEHARKSMMKRLWPKPGHNLLGLSPVVPYWKAINVQALLVGRPAPEADALCRILLLKTDLFQTILSRKSSMAR